MTKKVTAVLIDSVYSFMAPATIDLETFEVVRFASIYDTIADFEPTRVGLLTNNYKNPFRTYDLSIENNTMFVKNSQAKSAILSWSTTLNVGVATQLLDNDKIIKEKKILQELMLASINNANQNKPRNKL